MYSQTFGATDKNMARLWNKHKDKCVKKNQRVKYTSKHFDARDKIQFNLLNKVLWSSKNLEGKMYPQTFGATDKIWLYCGTNMRTYMLKNWRVKSTLKDLGSKDKNMGKLF